jgi:hypothetical protein
MPNTQLTRIPASRVPISSGNQGIMSREWYRFFFNLFTAAGSGEADSNVSSALGVELAPANTPQLDRKRHGVFYDTTTQQAGAPNTAYPITLNSTQISDGVYIGTPTSRVYVDRVGTYNFQFSIQLNKSSSNAKTVYIWYRLNGNDVSNSATAITLSGNSAAAVAAWNFVLEMNAGDYFELVWSTDDTGCQIVSTATVSPVPSIPSVILTVVDNIN